MSWQLDLPGVPVICFGVVFVGRDECNLPLSEICKGFLLGALNVQLEQKNSTGKHPKTQQTTPNIQQSNREQSCSQRSLPAAAKGCTRHPQNCSSDRG